MKVSCYLLVNRDGNIEFRKSQYTTKMGQIPIKINIEIPDKAFRSPFLEGTLRVSESDFNNTIRELEFELIRLKEDVNK